MKTNFILLLFLIIFDAITAQTLDATLVEINFHEDSDPQNLTESSSGFYFTATDGYSGNFGRELWYSNGSNEEVFMVKDILPGQNSSNPNHLVIVNNTLYFTAYDGANGTELWKSDGTEDGTVMVKNINPNNFDSYNGPYNLTNCNGILYFVASNDIDGYELWKSDGTENGTVMVKNINTNGSSSPRNIFAFNNHIYFTANDGYHGNELWKSDGTEDGTFILKDINPTNSALNTENQILILEDNFYFFANNGAEGFELWKSDGTEDGTVMVKNIASGSNSSAISLKGSILNNMIIFAANDGVNGTELWKTDGTELGTLMIRDINEFNNASSSPTLFTKLNNEVYFLANDNIHGYEIWKTNGTSSGTVLVKDIMEGNMSPWIEKIHPDQANNKILFFTTNTDFSDRTLWVSDGTENGTFELSEIKKSNISGIEENFISYNNHTYLAGLNNKYGNELWITDGTLAGTELFADMNHSNNGSPSRFADVGGELFFRGRGKEYGNQLFKSNGTEAGTIMVKDINPGYNCIDNLSEMKEINGTLFFSAVDESHGYELWKSDGTETGTRMVKDIYLGAESSMLNYNDKQYFSVINDILYFFANDGIHGFELWRSNGTEAGTYMIKDINTTFSYSSSYPREFVLLNNTIYFIAQDSTGTGLWTTDGSETGTQKIINLNGMRVLKAINDKLIIFAETSDTTYGPHDLWVSDGTSSGTYHLRSFGDGIDSDIRYTTVLNDEVYFVAKNPDTGRKGFYKTDGTIDGTVLLYDGSTHPIISNVDIDNIITCGSYVYFGLQEYSGFSDIELWRTNGIVTEKIAGSNIDGIEYIKGMICFNNNLLFLAELFPHNIWTINDNLNEPLNLNIDVINGSNFENYDAIEELGGTSNNLYLRARNEISGSELYIIDTNSSTLSNKNNFTLQNNNKLQLVTIYPNPANNLVYIKSLTDNTIVNFELWDLSGKKLYQKVYENQKKGITYDVNSLSKGFYLIKIKLSNGKVTTKKLIID